MSQQRLKGLKLRTIFAPLTTHTKENPEGSKAWEAVAIVKIDTMSMDSGMGDLMSMLMPGTDNDFEFSTTRKELVELIEQLELGAKELERLEAIAPKDPDLEKRNVEAKKDYEEMEKMDGEEAVDNGEVPVH